MVQPAPPQDAILHKGSQGRLLLLFTRQMYLIYLSSITNERHWFMPQIPSTLSLSPPSLNFINLGLSFFDGFGEVLGCMPSCRST